ncbi:box H/ACA snoRNP assembly protein SHQ1, putative [Rhizoctonia solani AG-3 Rhs1AP]|uniref:Box H/ACA snoRNP assembly protein SHQ1, putative n=2 Tax=Rhizoctonia solani AG-3 TaxID=1086053 RepID=X8JTU9_9AGAM|nr:box H/ACA snoRNP assembly protein SHQ1, putative [Rhizoctonia solani AG-3 Rhs1AP]KEP55555.1 putative box H/ACA snoRNP assembly protein SHQ1 [Rhizoctonia solani 123E]
MITPKFSCSQDDNSVVVQLYVPAVRAADVEIHVEDTLFSAHINPYFLRLNFPHPVLEDDESSASYDPSSGTLTVKLTKETKGIHFPDLDLLSKLLAPRSAAALNDEVRSKGPLIEVLDTLSPDTLAGQLDDRLRLDLEPEHAVFARAAENDWQIEQVTPDDELPDVGVSASTRTAYGFLDLHTGYFMNVVHTENEVNELGAEAENSTIARRRELREASEDAKWDEEHYIADFVDDEIIKELMNAEIPSEQFVFTEDENMTMLRLPRREYLLTPDRTRELHIVLCTILFASQYDWRTTQGDPTPESTWTICKLVPAFCALDPCPAPVSLRSALRASYRRALAFPLYRSFPLCQRVQKDVVQLLGQGTRAVTRRLLATKKILDSHDVYYVYSKIWVDDFCAWLTRHSTDTDLKVCGSELAATQITRAEIGWDLDELEQAVGETEPDSDDEDVDEVERMTAAAL